MAHTFNCPNCGAPLDYPGDDPIIRCPYCQSSVIVPENLRARPSFSNTPGNFTLSGVGNLASLVQQARRLKEVKDLAQAGDVEQAIDLYRDITGADEFSARNAVNALAADQPITLSGLTAAQVATEVRRATQPRVNIPQPSAGTKQLGCFLGLGITLLVVGILASVLIPTLGIALLSAQPDSIQVVLTNIPEAIPTLFVYSSPTPDTGFAREIISFGGEGTGPGLFDDVRAIASAPNGEHFYAADYTGGRIQAFDSAGTFVTQWMLGEKDAIILDMAVDRAGQVYILSGGNIHIFNAEGQPVTVIQRSSTDYYDSIDIGADGNLYLISRGETIVKLSPDGAELARYPEAIRAASGDSELSGLIAVDGLGNIYILGRFANAVFIFGPDGKYTSRFGSDGDQPGQFRAPYSIEVDSQGRIFVGDFKGVQMFAPDGRYLDVADGLPGAIRVVQFDDENNMYISTSAQKIYKMQIIP